MSSFLVGFLKLAFSCQAIVIASSAHDGSRKLMRTEKGKHQQAAAHQDEGDVTLELGSSGGLIHSAEASRDDALMQTVDLETSAFTDDASNGALQQEQDRTEESTTGYHSSRFQRAHDTLMCQLRRTEAVLRDWLSRNCIASKERQLANKQRELRDYQGANANAWWKRAWSWIRRTYQNLFNNTENRLKREVAIYQSQLNLMRAQKSALERQVWDMRARVNANRNDHSALLNGLNNQVYWLYRNLQNHQNGKNAAQSAHNQVKQNMIAEGAAATAVFTQLIANIDAATHAKRDVFYSVSATCAQYEKEGKNECRKCSGNQRACGDSCISKNSRCWWFPGCACDDTVGHELHQDFSETKAALEDTIKYHEAEINTHNDLLAQNQLDIDNILADKEDADKAFDTETQRVDAYKTQLQKGKSTAEQAKQDATNALTHATHANQAAITQLATDLRATIEKLQKSQDEEKEAKIAALIAQEAAMKELMETQAATIAGWDAKIQEAQTEHETMSSEASDLSAAIANATASTESESNSTDL